MDSIHNDLPDYSSDRKGDRRRRALMGGLFFLNVLGSAIGLGVAVHSHRETTPRIHTQDDHTEQPVGMKARTYPTMKTLATVHQSRIETTTSTQATTTTTEDMEEDHHRPFDGTFNVYSMEDLPLLGTFISKDGTGKESITFFGTRNGEGTIQAVSSALVSFESNDDGSSPTRTAGIRFIFDSETGRLSSLRNEETGHVHSILAQNEPNQLTRVTFSSTSCEPIMQRNKAYPWPEDINPEESSPMLHHVAYTVDTKYCGPEPEEVFVTEQYLPYISGSMCPSDVVREFVGGVHHNAKLVHYIGSERFHKIGTHLFRAQRTIAIPSVQHHYDDVEWTKRLAEETCRNVMNRLSLESESLQEVAETICPAFGSFASPCAKSVSLLSKLSGFSHSSIHRQGPLLDCSTSAVFLNDCQIMGLSRGVIAIPYVSWKGRSIPYKPYQYKWQSNFPNDIYRPSEMETILADDAVAHDVGRWQWTLVGQTVKGSSVSCESTAHEAGMIVSGDWMSMKACSLIISSPEKTHEYILDPPGGSSKEEWASYDHSLYVTRHSTARIVSPFEIELTSESIIDLPGDLGICRLEERVKGRRGILQG